MRVKNILFYLVFVAFTVFVALAIYQYQKEKEKIPPGFVFVSGRLEGDTITVATKIAGRVEAIYFKEGNEVKAGTLLAKLSSQELSAKLKAADAAISEAKAHLEEVASLISEATAIMEQSKRDLHRFENLYQQKLIPKIKLEQAELAYDQAIARLESLKKRHKSIRAAIRQLNAQREEVKALLEDTKIRAPANGVIIRKVTNLGEVLSPGGTIALMVNLDSLYLKAYVPEREIGRVGIGQEARIYIDAFPNRSFDGYVGYIAKRAEFTPKEVQTKAARIKQVYAVKIFLRQNPDHILTPGMPADALIKVEKDINWPKVRPFL